jgi:hypothetical protein
MTPKSSWICWPAEWHQTLLRMCCLGRNAWRGLSVACEWQAAASSGLFCTRQRYKASLLCNLTESELIVTPCMATNIGVGGNVSTAPPGALLDMVVEMPVIRHGSHTVIGARERERNKQTARGRSTQCTNNSDLLPQRLSCYWGEIVSLRMLISLRLVDLCLTTAQQRSTGQNLPSDLYIHLSTSQPISLRYI